MTTKHLGIRNAVAALLVALLPADRIHTNRAQSLPDGVASDIVVARRLSVPERNLAGATAPIDWQTELRITIRARTVGAATAEATADALMAQVYALVMTDTTLGGSAMDLDPGAMDWSEDEAETGLALVTWDCRVMHRTTFDDITT